MIADNDFIKKNECCGYALYIVLVILTVAAIFLSVTFRHIGFANKQTSNELHKMQARLLAQSGITRAEYFLNGGDGHSMDWETDSFIEPVEDRGKITLGSRRFGLFKKIVSRGEWLKKECTISGLFGRDIPQLLKPSLTLTGHVGGLILYEGSSIDGLVTLHHGDIYRQRRGRPLAEYQNRLILRESGPLPFDSLVIPDLFEKFKKAHISLLSNKHALTGKYTISNIMDSLLQSDTIVVLGNCQIETGPLIGKMMVVSGNLTVKNGTVIEESQLFAEKVNIEGGECNSSIFYSTGKMMIKGGYNSSQFFSSDTISCAKIANFSSMTVVTCLRSIKDSLSISGGVYFEDGTNFKGTVISCADSSVKRKITTPSITFSKNCTVSGTIVTDHDIDIKGIQVKGHVWARAIVTTDEGKSYTNYLINSRIEKPDGTIKFPLLGGIPVKVFAE